MRELEKRIELKTNNCTQQLILECKYIVQDSFTFTLFVTSGSFRGETVICIRREQIVDFIGSMEQLYAHLEGSTELNDNDSDSFLTFTMMNHGHIKLKGRVGGTHEDHYMCFEFVTDQTVIPQFVEELKGLLLDVPQSFG